MVRWFGLYRHRNKDGGMTSIFASRLFHVGLILVVTSFLTLPTLGSTSLWDIDEGLNAEAAREMHESGNWVVPYFNFKPRTSKPPLLYWLQAIAYRTFGVNEFAARLPSAIAAAVAALLTYRLGRRMFSPLAGLTAAVILLSSVQICVLAQAATPDALLLATLMITFTLFWEGYADGGGRWLWLTGIGCGLAVLAKGPIGLVLPLAIVTYFLLAQKQLWRLWDVRLFGGVALFILVAAPWYVLVSVETRGAFLRAFWQNDNVGRFLSPMEGHDGPLWYYLVTVPLGLTPWCVFLAPTICDTIPALKRDDCGDSNASGCFDELSAVRFLVSWIVVYLAFFSLAQTKLPNYAAPVFPPLALLTGRFLERWRLGESRAPNWLVLASIWLLAGIGISVAAGIMIAAGVVLPGALGGQALAGLGPWAVVGAIPVIGAGLAMWRLRRDRRPAVIAITAVTAVVFLVVSAVGPGHVVDAEKAPKSLVEYAGARRPFEEIRIASFCYFQPSLVFYCEREVRELRSERDAVDFLRGPLRSFLVCPADVAAALQVALPQVRVLDRRRDFYKGFEVCVLSN
jgi:4-amino-4-deoxy-L-arabinose transferase-like glycosyltransferase